MEEITEQDIKEHEEFLASEDNRNLALSLASQIRNTMGANWFTIAKFVAETTHTPEVAFQKCQLCKMFGYAEMKIVDNIDGKTRLPMFKIVLSKAEKIKALQETINSYKQLISQLESQIAQLW